MSPYDLTKFIVFTHFFIIENPSYEIKKHIHAFVKPLVLYDRMRGVGNINTFVPTKVFSSRTNGEKEYRLHINQFEEFKTYLRNHFIRVDEIPVEMKPLYMPEVMHYPVLIEKSPRDYQLKAIDYLTKIDPTYRTSLIGLPTGTGKTFCGLYGANKIGSRLVIIILPIYIDKWVSDIQSNLGVDPKSIMVVRGLHQVAGLLEMGQNGTLNQDFIIISLVTLRTFIETYDENPHTYYEQFPVAPWFLYETIQAGQVLIDETHQHIHAVFKIMTAMHVPKLNSLTATLITDNHVVKRVHEMMYPRNCRYDELLMEKYIDVYAIDYAYSDFKFRKIQYREFGSNTYSHTAYEKSIMRHPKNQDNYLKMLGYFVTNHFATSKAPGDKAIVYVSTKKFGAIVVDYLSKLFEFLEVRRYMEDDPMSHLDEADIIVSTIISAGTALDIPNLTRVFMTVNVSSPVANAQNLGRLRKLPGKQVEFYYFYCTNIDKHLKNHQDRKHLFQDRVRNIKELRYPNLL